MSPKIDELGKVAVPDAILNNPDRLAVDEYQIIKTHPDVSRRLLIDHPLAALAESAVFVHHERPDGMGYPQRLSQEQISVDARIVGICDAFDFARCNNSRANSTRKIFPCRGR